MRAPTPDEVEANLDDIDAVVGDIHGMVESLHRAVEDRDDELPVRLRDEQNRHSNVLWRIKGLEDDVEDARDEIGDIRESQAKIEEMLKRIGGKLGLDFSDLQG